MEPPRKGRGHGAPALPSQNIRSQRKPNDKLQQNPCKNGSLKEDSNSSRKFEEACAEIQANVNKHVAKFAQELDDSSSEEEVADHDGDIISQVVNLYGISNKDLKRTEQILQDSLRKGATVCLICIGSVKKSDPIWSCSKCYCSLHLHCVQKWAKDSIHFQSEAASDLLAPGQLVDTRKFKWCCPKCRAEYSQQSIPTGYFCFCTKTKDPSFDPWLLPHSCGLKCEKPLQPACNHSCLLLCHPGPCPPCPQMVTVTCFCKKSAPQGRRCSSQTWSCSQKCLKLLSCREHKCEELCHEGSCPPCPRKSIQTCLCGGKKEERPCHAVDFQCEKVCGKPLACGHHNCEVVCHTGKCSSCPLTQPRTCPCGKKSVTVACTVEIGSCGDTCGKLLACGTHYCAERCHKGPCGTCLQMRVQRCRCGLKEKELPCYKEFHCETKCKRMKDCRRHPCNRKCCTATCPPCDQPCNRTLGCKNHKCTSRCHQGPCYPCNLTVSVPCACGQTKITVPCGREKQTKPPKCNLTCKKPPNCHHKERTKHLCHFGSCPACKQACMKVYDRCGHICRAPCHTAVLVQVETPNQKRAGPWEPKLAPKMETKNLPCPPCEVPVPVTCLGEHETSDWPCHMAIPSSCGRPCGRVLYCTNHICTKPCHQVTMTPRNCELCELPCSKPRPESCTHPCSRGKCHPDACPPCTKMLRISCHCGLNPQLIRCNELSDCTASGQSATKDQLLSCKDRCPKLLACKHRCPLSCHPGSCVQPTECSASAHAFCPCKRIKKAVPCHSLSKQPTLSCNDACLRQKEMELKQKEEKERALREEEERKNRIELEQFQRKFDKKRNKDRRRIEEEPAASSRSIYAYILAALVLVISLVFGVYWGRL